MGRTFSHIRQYSFIRALIFPALAALASPVMADDLKSVVAEALETNPETRFEAEALEELLAEKRQEQGGYLPSVDLSLSAGQARRDFDSRGTFDRHYAEVSVTQMLFDGFRTSGLVELADRKALEQFHRLSAEAENKALEVTRAYLDVRRYRHLKALAEQNVQNHIEVYDHVKKRAEQRVGSQADLNQAEGRLALARANLRTEISNLQSVTARFQRLVGHAPGQTLQKVTALDRTLPQDLESVLKSAFANNPEIQAAFANMDATEASLQVAKSGHYPTLELGLRHGTYQNNNSFDARTDPDQFGDETILELRLDYNLYRGGSDRAAAEAAYHRISKAQSLRDKQCVDIRQTTTIAWSELGNLQNKLDLLRAHRESANEVVRAYQEQFNIGRRSLLDVLDAENEAFQAERSLTHGQYDLLLTRADVLNGMGKLLETLELARPTHEQYADDETPRNLPAKYCAAASDALVQLN